MIVNNVLHVCSISECLIILPTNTYTFPVATAKLLDIQTIENYWKLKIENWKLKIENWYLLISLEGRVLTDKQDI